MTPEQRATVGGLIRAIRIERGFQQEPLAEKWGLSQSSVSKVENGQEGVDLREVYDFCKVVGIPMEEFARRLAQKFAEDDNAR